MAKHNSSRHIPERFLRQLWKHRSFNVSALQTTDKRPVEIISSGSLNPDGGPDFVNATIRVGGTLFRGDIELHHKTEDWSHHAHDRDSKYNGVILHVVLHAQQQDDLPKTESGRVLPVLALGKYLHTPYHETWNAMIANERSERTTAIKCFELNHDVDDTIIKAWLNKLAIERMEIKIRRFEERLKELVDTGRLTVTEPPARYNEIPFGINPEDLPPPVQTYSHLDVAKPRIWEQLLYEGVMESLGYSKNQSAFLRLARAITLQYMDAAITEQPPDDRHMVLESILFHVSGLLPRLKDVKSSRGKIRVRELRKKWRQVKDSYRGEYLQSADWQFFRLRPENFPTVRLAGAANLLERFLGGDTLKSLVGIVKNNAMNNKQKLSALEDVFITPADEFWSTHYRFEEPAKTTLSTLIGKNRSEDIVLNVVIPVCLLYARLFKDKEVRRGTLRILEACPAAAGNNVTQTIDNQLIRKKFALASAKLQQGAIQLYKCYCIQDRCGECAVGNVVFPDR
jgi:hypothetical protein